MFLSATYGAKKTPIVSGLFLHWLKWFQFIELHSVAKHSPQILNYIFSYAWKKENEHFCFDGDSNRYKILAKEKNKTHFSGGLHCFTLFSFYCFRKHYRTQLNLIN